MFPLGVSHYIIGGLLVGFGVLLAFFFRGSPLGASTMFAAVCSWFSGLPFFREERLLEIRSSRTWFSVGFVLGAFVLAWLLDLWFVTDVPLWRLVVGGFLVGFGTRMGRGCTSGHGVCGLGSRSGPSLLAVVIFVFFAIVTAWAVRFVGGVL